MKFIEKLKAMAEARKQTKEDRKKRIIAELIEGYSQNFTVGKEVKKVSEEDIARYLDNLKKLDLSRLAELVALAKESDIGYKLMDKYRKLNKKRAFLVTLFRVNGTITHHIVEENRRVFNLEDKTYVIEPQAGKYDASTKITSFFYIENIPVPLRITKEGLDYMDAQQLKKIIRFEFVEKLAQLADQERLLIINLVLGGVNAFLMLVVIGMLIKGFGWMAK